MKNVSKTKQPVIFSFQVTKIKPVKTTKEMKEWESLMQKRAGIKIGLSELAGAGTTSCCPDCDDCDMV
ncbi:MAG: hypothetical protein JNM00_08990 [Flavobacteriales bacterium]|nr:hypothetical protein [Flavobacteriales bacterium]